MASSDEGRRLTKAHQQQLLLIKAKAVHSLMNAWPDLDWIAFERMWPQWVSFAYRICAENRRGAVLLTASYLRRHRVVEGVPDDIVPTLARSLDQTMFETSMNATARSRLMRAAYRSSVIDDPDEARTYLMQERRKALDDAAGAFARHVLNGSRETIMETHDADRRVLGYARVLQGDKNCAFCAMLASRGADYKSKESGRFVGASGRIRGARAAGEKFHDWCDCSVELVYSDDYETINDSEALEDLWTATTYGLAGKEAYNAFRRAYEDR